MLWIGFVRCNHRIYIGVCPTDIYGNCSAHSRIDRQTDNRQRPQSNMSNGPDRITRFQANADWAEDARQLQSAEGICVCRFFFGISCRVLLFVHAIQNTQIQALPHSQQPEQPDYSHKFKHKHSLRGNAFKRKLSLTSKN